MQRRIMLGTALLLPAALAACGVVNQDYVEPRRYPLAPRRADALPRGRGRHTVLMRLTRAAPGLDSRLLRFVRPDGTEGQEYYAEWTAPPAEAAEEALRRWVTDAGLFTAVLAPGSRGNADLTLESELVALHADLGRGVAVAAMTAVVLRETSQFGTRVAAQYSARGTAPLPPDRPLHPDALAAAMVSALGDVMGRLESDLRSQA